MSVIIFIIIFCYIDKLNYLFQLHDKELKRCEKTKLDEETKILLSAEEIVKIWSSSSTFSRI